MKRIAPLLLLLALVAAPAARAGEHVATIETGSAGDEAPARWAARHAPADRGFDIATTDGSTILLLTRQVVALQLSDHEIHKMDRDFHREERESDGPLADAIKGAVMGGVRRLLDHSLECPLAEVRDAAYRDGRLVLTARDGKRLFEKVKVNDHEVLASFSAHDAQAFVREFQRQARHGR